MGAVGRRVTPSSSPSNAVLDLPIEPDIDPDGSVPFPLV